MENRSFGLDVLRSVGIWMVMISHVAYWFGPQNGGTYYTVVAPLLLGVEPFFVLGGFLAAISFLQILTRNEGVVRGSDAATYIRRRWVRTLPNYFLFLVVYYVAFTLTKPGFSFDVKYLVFSQNLFWLAPNFFSVSWSLSTQEWFYVLLPVFLILFSRTAISRTHFNPLVLAALALILISFVARIIYLAENPVDNLEGPLRRILLLRLDSVAVGVLVGHIYFSQKSYFAPKSFLLFMLGLIAIIALCYLRRTPEFSGSYLVQLFFYPVFSLSLGLCMPWIYEIGKPDSKFQGWLFESTSKWSYSLYLSHVFFLDGLYFVGSKAGWQFNGGLGVAGLAMLWVLITYTTSAFLYRYFEKPMLRLGNIKTAGFFGNLPKSNT